MATLFQTLIRATTLLALGINMASAAEWKPDKVIELIVPTGPGSGVDASARTVQSILQARQMVEQAINTTNKPGGNYGIAMNYLGQFNGDAVFDVPRGFIGPRGLTADQVRYWDGVFARLVKSDDWKQAVEKNQWVEDYRNSADMGKELRRQYGILKDVLSELGMVQ